MIDATDHEEQVPEAAFVGETSPARKLFQDDGVRPLPFASPFINPAAQPAPQEEADKPNDGSSVFDGLSKKDSRHVNRYFRALFNNATQPVHSTEERRLSMKDSQVLESVSLAPLEGVKILGGSTKVTQWMTLQSALKLRRSQVSLWSDLTYILIGTETIDLLKKPFAVDIATIKKIATQIWTEPHVMSKATDGKTAEFARRVFAKLLLSTLDPDFKQSILSRIGESESILANDGPLLYVLIV
jgi:hypothetical protein